MIEKIVDIVWVINHLLMGIVPLLVAVIIVDALVRNFRDWWRYRAQLRLKENLSAMQQAGGPSSERCRGVRNEFSTHEFFVFFQASDLENEPGRSDLRFCINHTQKIRDIQKRALRGRKWNRIEAIVTLGHLQDPSSVEILEKCFLLRDEDIRYYTLLSLGKIRTPGSARVIFSAVEKRIIPGNRAASFLEKFPEQIVDVLVEFMKKGDAPTRFWALRIMVKFPQPQRAATVEALTRDVNPDVRSAACQVLGAMASPGSRPALTERLKDDAWFVRMQALRSLVNICGEECVDDMKHLIHDPSVFVLAEVENVMARYIERFLPLIEEQLKKDKNPDPKVCCINAMVKTGYIVILLTDLVGQDTQKKEFSARLLRLLIRSRIFFGLRSALQNFESGQREQILEFIENEEPDLRRRIAPMPVGEGAQ